MKYFAHSISLFLVVGLLIQALAFCPDGGDLILSPGSNGCVTVTGFCDIIFGQLEADGSASVCPNKPVPLTTTGNLILGGQPLTGGFRLTVKDDPLQVCASLDGCANGVCEAPVVCVPAA
jgi:hypothetical protein